MDKPGPTQPRNPARTYDYNQRYRYGPIKQVRKIKEMEGMTKVNNSLQIFSSMI